MDRWTEHTGQGQLVWTMAMATSQDYFKPISESSVLVSATSQGCCGETHERYQSSIKNIAACLINKLLLPGLPTDRMRPLCFLRPLSLGCKTWF